jgi:hypothetical protein
MKPRNGAIVALFFLATCNEEAVQNDAPSKVESAKVALGVVPSSEVAVWQKVGSNTTPDARYLQAAAFDETRKVVVMFGGATTDRNTGVTSPNKETWEWSPATGKWTNRTGTGDAPDARTGAAMVFDSARGKFVLFGGRSGGSYDYEDTWEWDPTTGAWTDVSAAGGHPTARSQHGMVYEKSTGKIMLFGGGRSDSSSYDLSGVTASLGDTWEYDPTTYVWTALTVATTPSARHDFGMVWDSSRSKAVLFAGIQLDIAGSAGVPKQDTWDWDPAAGTWTERTAKGTKPGQRYAHATAFDASRNKVVVFGGWDISTGGSRNDLWDWDPTTGVWTQRLTGSESGTPSGRTYATMVADNTNSRLELVAGQVAYNPYGSGTGGYYGTGGSMYGTGGSYYGAGGAIGSGGSPGFLPPGPIFPPLPGMGSASCEVWELNPATPAFTNRTPPLDVPTARYGQAMAYNPSTAKTYIFGGYDTTTGQSLDDLWEWDGKTWAQVTVSARPPARVDAGLAYDPTRKSLILYGGAEYYASTTYGDTWEWDNTGKWTQLTATKSPDPLSGHGLVTDTIRNKILLFGGAGDQYAYGVPYYSSPTRNDVWEWDGATLTWTNRTPVATIDTPSARQNPILAYDEGRQKLFLYDGGNYSGNVSSFWEWDPVSAGWETRDTGDQLQYGSSYVVAYDSLRRREVMLTSQYYYTPVTNQETWEIDAKGPTWYVRSLPNSPAADNGATMAFDKGRGVMVLFSGQGMTAGNGGGETWEYTVTKLGKGEGCTAASAASCSTGFCVDGVCCATASCTGVCKSCNVAGYEGICASAKAGTEVAGSCSTGQACDGSGNCLANNGQACTGPSTCASGHCADGVCCDSACTGTCTSCKQVGHVGQCSAYAAGTDPQNECGQGTGVCKSTCDGVGNCAYPAYTVSCGNCYTCDGYGSCTNYDYNCYNYGAGGSPYPYGGVGGSPYPYSGTGGSPYPYSGAGGSPDFGGTGPNLGGSSGNPDGGPGNGVNLHKSGCSCRLGPAELADPGLTTPLLIAGVALLLARKRRRKG